MDEHLIKTLIDALEASSLTELEYSQGGATLRLSKRKDAPRTEAPTKLPPATAPAVDHKPEPVSTPDAAFIVTAPLFGVVHLQRTPSAPFLVTMGEEVSSGQVLCIIEAMKVFAELRADRDGKVSAILVQSGQEVEAGQPLFRME